MAAPRFVYKIATREAFELGRRTGQFSGMPIDIRDGYIHLSTAEQLAETLKLHFAGQSGLVVFAVPVAAIADLRWEPSRGGALFPHLYGELPMSAIGHSAAIEVSPDGSVTLPAWVE